EQLQIHYAAGRDLAERQQRIERRAHVRARFEARERALVRQIRRHPGHRQAPVMTSGLLSSNAPEPSNSRSFLRCSRLTTSSSAASTVSVSVLVPSSSRAASSLSKSTSNEVFLTEGALSLRCGAM